MLGTLNPLDKRATVVGAGISGLLIAYHLQKKGYDVQVLEASPRAGGLIETVHHPFGLVERAAHSLLVHEGIAPFFEELSLNLVEINPDSRARYIVRNRKPKRVPLTFIEILGILFRFFWKPKLTQAPDQLTLEEWGHAYLGQAATQFLLNPFVTGVYACQPKDLLTQITFPSLVPQDRSISLFQHFRLRKKQGSKPKSKMMALEHGMQSLVDALVSKLKNPIQFNTRVDSLQPYLDQGNLILTTPASVTAQLLSDLDPQSSTKLKQVRYSPLVSVTGFFNRESFQNHPPCGVGVLIPRSEPYRLLGSLYNSSAFSNRVRDPAVVSLTMMLGGTSDPHAIDLSDDAIKSVIEGELKSLLGLSGPILHLEMSRWSQAIPLYDSSLQQARIALNAGFCAKPGQIVFSNFSKEVSIRGMIESLC